MPSICRWAKLAIASVVAAVVVAVVALVLVPAVYKGLNSGENKSANNDSKDLKGAYNIVVNNEEIRKRVLMFLHFDRIAATFGYLIRQGNTDIIDEWNCAPWLSNITEMRPETISKILEKSSLHKVYCILVKAHVDPIKLAKIVVEKYPEVKIERIEILHYEYVPDKFVKDLIPIPGYKIRLAKPAVHVVYRLRNPKTDIEKKFVFEVYIFPVQYKYSYNELRELARRVFRVLLRENNQTLIKCISDVDANSFIQKVVIGLVPRCYNNKTVREHILELVEKKAEISRTLIVFKKQPRPVVLVDLSRTKYYNPVPGEAQIQTR